MAAYTNFLNVLPDPNNPIGDGGQALTTGNGGTVGPGYSTVQIESTSPTQVSTTNSGRVISRAIAGHIFGINITYNPMTRAQFEPVYNFLVQKSGRLKPFFVQLPQQYTSTNSAFATYVAGNTPTCGVVAQGSEFMLQANHSGTQSTNPEPGDMFTITDANDSLHTKSYRVTRVMTNATYHSGIHPQPTTVQRVIYFHPPLQRAISSSATINYNKPLFRVILKSDVQAYTLGTTNLYTFSLNLQEAQA